jgi:hypothetical protein
MSTILVLNSSVSGVTSVSRILVEEAVSRLLEAEPGATVVHRDLGAVPIPHLTTTNLAGIRGVPATDVELAARALSDQLIAELRAADTIVICAPGSTTFCASGKLSAIRRRARRACSAASASSSSKRAAGSTAKVPRRRSTSRNRICAICSDSWG